MFGEGEHGDRAAVGMRGTRQAGGRLMGRRPSTVAAAVMRARGFGPRKEREGGRGTRYLFAVERNGC